MFTDLFNEVFGPSNLANIYEEQDGTQVLEILVPGYSKEDLEITTEQDYLKIKGKQKKSNESRHYIRQEFRPRRIDLTYGIPDTLDPEKTSAKVSNGILTVRIPKREGSAKRNLISIE